MVKALSSALVLVAPAGFSEGDRRAWLTVAAGTLSGIPADLLARGVAEARKVVDHPSKIVAAIMAEVGAPWERRKEDLRRERAEFSPPPAQSDDKCTPEQAAAIMAEFGLKEQSRESLRKHLGPPKAPTRQDYLDMGVDPATLDKMEADARERAAAV